MARIRLTGQPALPLRPMAIFRDGRPLPNKAQLARVVKFSPDGRFIKSWGHWGRRPATSRSPTTSTSAGHKDVYVADRQNNRIQVFDQDGNFIAAWKQFGQPSSVYVDKETTSMSARRSRMRREASRSQGRQRAETTGPS